MEGRRRRRLAPREQVGPFRSVAAAAAVPFCDEDRARRCGCGTRGGRTDCGIPFSVAVFVARVFVFLLFDLGCRERRSSEGGAWPSAAPSRFETVVVSVVVVAVVRCSCPVRRVCSRVVPASVVVSEPDWMSDEREVVYDEFERLVAQFSTRRQEGGEDGIREPEERFRIGPAVLSVVVVVVRVGITVRARTGRVVDGVEDHFSPSGVDGFVSPRDRPRVRRVRVDELSSCTRFRHEEQRQERRHTRAEEREARGAQKVIGPTSGRLPAPPLLSSSLHT